MSTVAFISAVLRLRHELLESLLRHGLWALSWMPQVFHKVSPSALSEIRCLLVSALGLILLQPRGSYPLPSLIEFHPMHLRFDGRPNIKGIPCRFLQLFLWATPFPPASALKTPAPSFSVFSAKCNLYVLLCFLSLHQGPESVFRQESGTTIGLTLSVSLVQTSEDCTAYCQISENRISYILTSILVDCRGRWDPHQLSSHGWKSLQTSTHIFYYSTRNYSHFLN